MAGISRRQVVQGAAARFLRAERAFGPGPERSADPSLYPAGRSEDPRSCLDDRLPHAEPRLSCVRYTLWHGRAVSDQTTNGRTDDCVSGWDEVHVHPARWPSMA